MIRRLDWKAKEAYAKSLTDAQLCYAAGDCEECRKIWEQAGDRDTDGNAAYYSDEKSVYIAEFMKRSRKVKRGRV